MTQQANVNTARLTAQGNVLNATLSLSQPEPTAKRPRRRRAATPTLEVVPAVREPELAPEDLAYAVRYFAALRKMQPKMATTARNTFLASVESLAEDFPIHQAPRLRLVAGGAK